MCFLVNPIKSTGSSDPFPPRCMIKLSLSFTCKKMSKCIGVKCIPILYIYILHTNVEPSNNVAGIGDEFLYEELDVVLSYLLKMETFFYLNAGDVQLRQASSGT